MLLPAVHRRHHRLSLHSFGIAVDLNVSENQRGTAGSTDPRVVEIFRSRGFTWGAAGTTPIRCTSS
ncbi:M15 family metallopeptidase [Nocardioides sp.]|uniref:M15 family metallopeptidase n=1 Tax=Nocardioides sp. TaxID=35761 RepID=UPI0039E32724